MKNYFLILTLALAVHTVRAQQVYPVFCTQMNFPANRIMSLHGTGLVLLASDVEVQLWDRKSQAYYGSINIPAPENVYTRIRHVEYLEDLKQLAIVAEQINLEGNAEYYKDFLLTYDLETQMPLNLPAANGMAALLKYKYGRKYILPAIKNEASVYQYYFSQERNTLYTIDRSGELNIYKAAKLENTFRTGAVRSRLLHVDETGSTAFITDDSTVSFRELNLTTGALKHLIQMRSLPACKNNEALFADYKNYMVRAIENGSFLLLDSINRIRTYVPGKAVIPTKSSVSKEIRLTAFNWDGADSTLLLIAESPSLNCKTIAAADNLKTRLSSIFYVETARISVYTLTAYDGKQGKLRIAIPNAGEHETALGKLLETPVQTYAPKTNFISMNVWEQGYVNIYSEGENEVSINVFQTELSKTSFLYTQRIALKPDEELAGIRPDTKWWITTLKAAAYKEGRHTVRIYDSLGRQLFSQQGYWYIQMLTSPFSGQQLFSANRQHIMLKEFIKQWDNYDSCRLRVYSTKDFQLEAEIRFKEVSGSILSERTAFFDRSSNSFYFTGVSTTSGIQQTVLFKYDLANGKATKSTELPLCAEPSCQLQTSINFIEFTHNNTSLTYSGLVNTSSASLPPGYMQIVRRIKTDDQTLIWYLNLPATNIIRRVLHFQDYIGLQTDTRMEFIKIVNGVFEQFLSLVPVLNPTTNEFSNLYISAGKNSNTGIYYEQTGNESMVSFRAGNKSFSRGFFDLSFNRPDEIIARIPGGDSVVKEQFHNAVIKRAGRITNRATGFDAQNIPEVKLLNTKSSIDSLGINLLIKSKSPVKYLRVSINGNVRLEPVTAQDRDSFYYALREQLVSGRNQFEISAVDNLDRESVPVSLAHNESRITQKPNLHVLVLAVSAYRYSDSLSWVMSNGKAIGELFSKDLSDTFFNKINVTSLYDYEVTGANVNKWLQQASSASPRDYVIVFFNGHGVLNKDLKLLLLTSETALNAPFTNAIAYQQVLDKMDSLPSRQKLLLIDACYSGDFDEAEPGLPRGRESNFDFMQKMFTFSNKGNGTFVYTSCAGNRQSASSPGGAGPGPFVMAIKEALAEGKAGVDEFGRIWINDFFKYVTARTIELSDKLQTPNLRITNPGVNWRIK